RRRPRRTLSPIARSVRWGETAIRMATKPKKKKKAAKGARKSAAKKSAAKKTKARKAAKPRGKKSARQRVAAPKASPSKRTAHRRNALRPVSGRRAKSVPSRGPARGRVTARRRIAKPAPATPRVDGVKIKAPLGPRYTEVLTAAALRFL